MNELIDKIITKLTEMKNNVHSSTLAYDLDQQALTAIKQKESLKKIFIKYADDLDKAESSIQEGVQLLEQRLSDLLNELKIMSLEIKERQGF